MVNNIDIVSKYVLVTQSTNFALIGKQGYCIYETKNMLYIEEAKSHKILKICKNWQKFCFTPTDSGCIHISGFKINNKVYKRNTIWS